MAYWGDWDFCAPATGVVLKKRPPLNYCKHNKNALAGGRKTAKTFFTPSQSLMIGQEQKIDVHSLVIMSFFPPAKEWVLSLSGPTLHPFLSPCQSLHLTEGASVLCSKLQLIFLCIYKAYLFTINPRLIQESSSRLFCCIRLTSVPKTLTWATDCSKMF